MGFRMIWSAALAFALCAAADDPKTPAPATPPAAERTLAELLAALKSKPDFAHAAKPEDAIVDHSEKLADAAPNNLDFTIHPPNSRRQISRPRLARPSRRLGIQPARDLTSAALT